MVLDRVSDRIEDFLGDSAKFSVIVENLVVGFKETVEDEFLFVVEYGASGEFEAGSSSDHLAIYDQN